MAGVTAPAESCALLVGVSAYEYAEFPPIRAARNSLNAMRSLLSDPALCGWPPDKVVAIANPVSAADLASILADLAESTTGALLLYYVGHGVLSARGELCLTVTSTRPDRPKISGLPWDTVADVLRSCPADTRLAILDCCFAGQAIEALTGDGDPGMADIVHVEGVYTLTATTRNRPAHVPPPGQQDSACTSFTAELRDLVRSGIPGKPPQLTLSDIYPVLRQRLRAKGLPSPREHGAEAARQFPFTANAAVPVAPKAQDSPRETPESRGPEAHDGPGEIVDSRGPGTHEGPGETADPRGPGDHDGPGEIPGPVAAASTSPAGRNPEPAQPDRSRNADIVADALRATHSITDQSLQAQALAAVADALAASDPGRAGRLAADAERVAQSIPDANRRESAVADVLGPLAAAEPDRAERVAQSVTHESSKARALAAVAQALAPGDPDRAGRLIADAERIAQSVPDARGKASALAAVARALAVIDNDRAERVARSIADPTLTATVLTALARAVAATDSDRAGRLVADAERVAQSVSGASFRAPALAGVAWALAASDPGRAGRLIADAEHIAQSIPDASRKGSALAAVAEGFAAIDPEHAELIAQSITTASSRAPALAAVAKALATGPV